MKKTPAYRKCHYVALQKPKPEDADEDVAPDMVFAAIEPAAPGAFDEEKITHIVTIDYHPDVTLNTRVVLPDDGDRMLWVKGIQDVEMRHIELRLLCEEVLTP